MKTAILTCAILAATASVAFGDPTLVTTSVGDDELAPMLGALKEHPQEPLGMAVTVEVAPKVARLKLVAGDVVRAIDGRVAWGWTRFDLDALAHHNAVFLDVARGVTSVVVRVALKPAAMQTASVERAHLGGLTSSFATLTGGKPGVAVLRDTEPFQTGDILRTLDGKPIVSAAVLYERATKRALGDKLVVTLDRGDNTVAYTLTLAAGDDEIAVEIDNAIKKIDDTHYSIDKSIIDKILANPMAIAKGARVVPSMKDGKPNGFKLYAIRPTSVFAKLGLQNGDTLNAINKMDLSSADKALEIYTKLRDAKTLVVDLTRRGKSITITYTIH